MITTGAKVTLPSTQCQNIYSRNLPGFQDKIEFGVVVPMEDYKFLRAFNSVTARSNHTSAATEILIDETLGDDIVPSYIKDLDDKLIKNTIIGPSSGSDSKGLIQIRPGHKGASLKSITIDKDSLDLADTFRMSLNANDNIIIATTPIGWILPDIHNSTVRRPKMIGISGHANSLIANTFEDLDFNLPLTDQGTIDHRFTYRFSFYYRINGSITIQPLIVYYTNEGSPIGSDFYSSVLINASDNENSDWRYFQIGIPRLALDEKIPENTKRMKIIIGTSSVAGKIEIAYPVLEHDFMLSATSGFIFMPEAPSSFSFKDNFSGKLNKSPIGSVIPFDSTKLFFSHTGRKLFDINMTFDLVGPSFLHQLRMLEWLSLMGFNIAFKPNHPDLPPVLKGSLRITNRNKLFDYQVNDISLKFEELE